MYMYLQALQNTFKNKHFCACPMSDYYIHIYMYISALHKAGKQGAVPRYFSKRPAMRPALKIIKFKIIND